MCGQGAFIFIYSPHPRNKKIIQLFYAKLFVEYNLFLPFVHMFKHCITPCLLTTFQSSEEKKITWWDQNLRPLHCWSSDVRVKSKNVLQGTSLSSAHYHAFWLVDLLVGWAPARQFWSNGTILYDVPELQTVPQQRFGKSPRAYSNAQPVAHPSLALNPFLLCRKFVC